MVTRKSKELGLLTQSHYFTLHPKIPEVWTKHISGLSDHLWLVARGYHIGQYSFLSPASLQFLRHASHSPSLGPLSLSFSVWLKHFSSGCLMDYSLTSFSSNVTFSMVTSLPVLLKITAPIPWALSSYPLCHIFSWCLSLSGIFYIWIFFVYYLSSSTIM